MRAITRRAIGVAAGIGSITAAITLGGIGTASAYAPAHHSGGGEDHCNTASIAYSVDGGQTWSHSFFGGDTPVTKFTVKLMWKDGDAPAKGCQYPVSLASYSTEGASWDTSGTQKFLGWDHTTLTKNDREKTLDVSQSAPECYGQTDLYNGDTKFDGGSGKGHGPLPYQPGGVNTPTGLITAWNGGHKCDATPTPTPTDSTGTPTPTPTDSTGTPTPTPTNSTGTPTPTDSTGTPTPTPTNSTGTPSSSPSGGTPTPVQTNPTPGRTGSTVVQPASTSASGNLAETGSNSSQNTVFLGGGAALLVAGGAAVYFTRRRRSGSHS